MPDSLPPLLSNAERQATADKLWAVVRMIDAGRPLSDVRQAVAYIYHEIQPPYGLPLSKITTETTHDRL